MPPLNLADLELQLIDILTTQGLPVEEIRLIGLLGQGTRATAFSVLIDGVYHVLKVYDSKESLQAELRNLRKVTPRDRFLFSWQDELENDRQINLAIIEVPEGQELNSQGLSDEVAQKLAQRLAELHSIRYRQRVSSTGLKQQLDRAKRPFLDHIELLGRDRQTYEDFFGQLRQTLKDQPDLFRTNKVRVHGDLWWPNVIVAHENVYFIDWESVHRGDACEDIAKLRLICFWYRDEVAPTFFWQSPEHGQRLSQLVATIIDTHQAVLGDESIARRLRFYLPLRCVTELASRYIEGRTELPLDKAWNQLLADEVINLFTSPIAPPPDLNKYGYYEAIEAMRGQKRTSPR